MRQYFHGNFSEFDQLWARLLPVAQGMGLNDHDAEEATQEALIAAWRWSQNENHQARCPLAFLTTSTRRKAIDLVKRRDNLSHPRVTFDTETLDHVADDGSDRPGDALERRELADHLLDRLGPKQRDAVWHLHAEDRSASTLASKVGVSPRAVRYRAARGLEEIRNRLEP